MVQPLRDSRDHYEELKQIDDAMTEVEPTLSKRTALHKYTACTFFFGKCETRVRQEVRHRNDIKNPAKFHNKHILVV